MHCFGRFACPFAVAGLGFKSVATSSGLRLGHPLRNPLCIAFKRDDIVGLHNDWWVNFTALAQVRTECENIAISVNSGLSSTFMGDCRSRAIQGLACDWADFVTLCVDHTTVPSG